MESIIRSVKDIENDKLAVLESVLGRKLHENEQVIVRVVALGVEPPPAVRDAALSEASEIASRGRAYAASRGVTADEADRAIDEAIQEVRKQKA